jgi:hypothetical protein
MGLVAPAETKVPRFARDDSSFDDDSSISMMTVVLMMTFRFVAMTTDF